MGFVNTKWNDLKQKERRQIAYKVPTVTSVQLVRYGACEAVRWEQEITCMFLRSTFSPKQKKILSRGQLRTKLLTWTLAWKDNKINVPKDCALSLALLVFVAL